MEARIGAQEEELSKLRILLEKIKSNDIFTQHEVETFENMINAKEMNLVQLKDRADHIENVWSHQLNDLTDRVARRENILNSMECNKEVFSIFQPEHIRLREQIQMIKADIEK